MNMYLPALVAGAFAGLVFLVAHVASLRARQRAAALVADGAAQAVQLRGLAGFLVRPALVLLLSGPAAWLLQHEALTRGWLAAHPAALKAWFGFWWLMLALGLTEFGLRFYYGLRARAFPVPALLRNIARCLLTLAAAFAVLRWVLGVDISPLLASTALLTAVVGFALQGVLGNLLAGMSLHIEYSMIPGDWVAIGEVEGEVVATNWRETRLRTVAGHFIVLPNSKVAEATIHNMSRPTPLRRHRLSVGASYADAPAEVIEALVAAARGVPDVLAEPPPSAFLTEFKDFGINYDLRFWTHRYHDRTPVQGEVQRRIWYEFKRRGIEIPFPMSDKLLNDFMEVVYHQRHLPPEEKELERRVADLRRSEFCSRLLVGADGQPLLAEADLLAIARLVRHVPFTRGETLFRQGEAGEAAYVLVRGTLQGRVAYQDAAEAHQFTIHPGALVGEMSLVTGLPRTATLACPEEVEVLEIARGAFTRLLALREDIPARLAGLVAERAAQNRAMWEKLQAMGPANIGQSLQRDSILQRFRHMLGG